MQFLSQILLFAQDYTSCIPQENFWPKSKKKPHLPPKYLKREEKDAFQKLVELMTE